MFNEAGTQVVWYDYDAWGNRVGGAWVVNDQDIYKNLYYSNPFGYRGYYLDSETGSYYCGSRYYDPVIGRFINADGYVNANGDLIGYNMYTYCGNNPVMFTDPSGELKSQGEIHNVVVKEIAAKYNMKAEIGLGIYGRADLIEIRDEKIYIYDVKPMWYMWSEYQSCGTFSQIVRYIVGAALKDSEIVNVEFGDRWFSGTIPYNEYLVVYFSCGNGVVSYFYYEIKENDVKVYSVYPSKAQSKSTKKSGKNLSYAIPIMIPAFAPSTHYHNAQGMFDFKMYQRADFLI